MKRQALFFAKDKSEKLIVLSAAILLGSLRVQHSREVGRQYQRVDRNGLCQLN